MIRAKSLLKLAVVLPVLLALVMAGHSVTATAPLELPAVSDMARPLAEKGGGWSGSYEVAKLGLDVYERMPSAAQEKASRDRASLADPAEASSIDSLEGVWPLGPLRDVMATSPDWSFRPHNSSSVAINPTNPFNIIVGMNDYSLGFGLGGYTVSHDGGLTWVKGLIPMTTLPITRTGRLADNGRAPDRGGNPVVAFARDGTAYSAQLHFTREDWLPDGSQAPIGRNGIFITKSINGGRTWQSPQIANPPPARGSTTPPNGVVVYEADPATGKLHDKEWMAVDPTTSTYSGRIYVTWTQFTYDPARNYAYVGSPIMMSYSSDGGLTFSPRKEINGSSTLCDYGTGGRTQAPCSDNQFSTMTIGRDGTVYVVFENFDTADENQLLVVKSGDGGATWEGPWRVANVYDSLGWYQTVNGVNCPFDTYGWATLPNSCFRVNSAGNIVVDPVTNDLYVVWADNRNGVRGVPKNSWSQMRYATESRFTTEPVMDVDVFISKSTDRGQTWSAPIRVNQDPMGNRKQQWFPWIDVSENGMIVVAYYDRRDDARDKLVHRYMSAGTRGTLAFSDFRLSSAASNFDNAFRGGLFVGDYDQIAIRDYYVYGSWTDSRFASDTLKMSDIFVATRAVGWGVPIGR